MSISEQVVAVVSKESIVDTVKNLAKTADDSVINRYRVRLLIEKLSTVDRIAEELEKLNNINIPHSPTCNKSQANQRSNKSSMCDCNNIAVKESIARLFSLAGLSYDKEEVIEECHKKTKS